MSTMYRQWVMAAVVAVLMASGSAWAGDAESLTSLRKKGAVKIGGEVTIDIIVSHRDDGDPNGDGVVTRSEDNDSIDKTTFHTEDAYLEVDVDISPDVTLNLLLDLDDFSDGSADTGDLLEECFFEWRNKFGGGWTFALGKKTVDYGSAEAPGITGTMQEDGLNKWLSDLESAGGGTSNTHAGVGSNSFGAAMTQPTDLFTIEAQYQYKDLLRVYAAVFQAGDGMHEDRSDDHLGLQSFAFKADLTPMERLTLSASMINWHLESMGDGPERLLNGDTSILSARDASRNSTAMSLYADYTFASVPLRVFAQYQHAWDVSFNDEVSADIATLFFVYGITEKVDLGLMGEFACIDDAAGYSDEDYWQVAANATYTTDYGVSFTAEYAYARYDGDVTGGGNIDRDAHIVGFRTSYSF